MFAVITQIPDSISKLGPALFSSVNCPVIACMTKSVTKYFNHGVTQLHCVRTQIVIAPAAGVLFAWGCYGHKSFILVLIVQKLHGTPLNFLYFSTPISLKKPKLLKNAYISLLNI